jgi:hypothetical protein
MTSVEQIARVCHEANRAYCLTIGDKSQKPWVQAQPWQRQSARDGVDFFLKNPHATPEALHDEWCAAKRRDGWKYGPVKDETKKEHPCLVLYPKLSPEQRRKDYLFRAIITAFLQIE